MFNVRKVWKIYQVEIIVWSLIAAFAILFSYLSIDRYLNLRSHYYDLGIMNQVVYNTSRGWILEMTNQELQANLSRFAIHFDPILAFFAPFYLLYADPAVLLIGQATIMALGGWAVYKIALLFLKNKWQSLFFVVVYFTYFPVGRMVLFDFHAVVLATTFILYAIYYGLSKRYWAGLLFVFLALLTKEHVGLVTGLLGLYFAIIRKEVKFGISVFAISMIFFAASVFYIIPMSRMAEHFASGYFGDVGDSPGKVLISLIKNPFQLIPYLMKASTQKYLSWLLLPYGLLAVLAPFELLIASPEFLMNIISTNGNMRSIYFQYNALITPIVIFGTIVGFRNLKDRILGKIYPNFTRLTYLILGSIFVFYLVQHIYYLSPLPLPFLHEPYRFKTLGNEKKQTIYKLQQLLKDDQLIVSTTPQLGPFFTNRRYYYNFLYDPAFSTMGIPEDDIIRSTNKYEKADYVVISLREINLKDRKGLSYRYYTHLQNNSLFEKVLEENGFELYRRKDL